MDDLKKKNKKILHSISGISIKKSFLIHQLERGEEEHENSQNFKKA